MIRIGTSGFSFPEWVGPFYPEGVREGAAMLGHYASRLDTVEINYTFRRHPSVKTLETWRQAVPDAFRFTLKAHQTITHRRRLNDAAEPVALFAERALTLRDRLGSVLFQLPPNMKADAERLATFCGVLPDDLRRRAAFEFRHDSWFGDEVYDVLRAAGCALVLGETDEYEARGGATAPLVYVRLRREEYPDERLGRWADRIKELDAAGHDVLCYLKHDLEAPRHALRLRELLG